MNDVEFKFRRVENGFVLVVNLGWKIEEYIFSKFDEMIEWIRKFYGWWIE